MTCRTKRGRPRKRIECRGLIPPWYPEKPYKLVRFEGINNLIEDIRSVPKNAMLCQSPVVVRTNEFNWGKIDEEIIWLPIGYLIPEDTKEELGKKSENYSK